MKISMYNAVKTIYSREGSGNMRPVAFDYVPYDKRGDNAASAREPEQRRFTGFRAAIKTA